MRFLFWVSLFLLTVIASTELKVILLGDDRCVMWRVSYRVNENYIAENDYSDCVRLHTLMVWSDTAKQTAGKNNFIFCLCHIDTAMQNTFLCNPGAVNSEERGSTIYNRII